MEESGPSTFVDESFVAEENCVEQGPSCKEPSKISLYHQVGMALRSVVFLSFLI